MKAKEREDARKEVKYAYSNILINDICKINEVKNQYTCTSICPLYNIFCYLKDGT